MTIHTTGIVTITEDRVSVEGFYFGPSDMFGSAGIEALTRAQGRLAAAVVEENEAVSRRQKATRP